ncbi:MAG: phosphatase PAP2 family protein [Methylotenera sp.]|nr:phosphatase PAP2 family protein [Methylotenera sp.]MSP99805.1 phosphatase PAP2 family protein [Methylotenera sp.]
MKSCFLMVILSLSFIASPVANAGSHKTWANISDLTAVTLAGTALVLPAVKDDWEGIREAAYSLGTAEAISLLGKAVVHEERPDHSDNNSFPSGHSAIAFASATTMYKRYGWEAGLPAYALATLTASARVAAKKHHWYDAAIGAAMGSASGWFFTDAFNNKVQLVPWADGKGAGIEATIAW